MREDAQTRRSRTTDAGRAPTRKSLRAPAGGIGPSAIAPKPRGGRAIPREPIYLASQLASICDVDLKTIHNWCDRPTEPGEPPALECFRTPGGHLRFRHSAVVRFLSRWGYPIPDSLLRDRPHLLFVAPEEKQRAKVIQSMGLVRPGEEDERLDDGAVPQETAAAAAAAIPAAPKKPKVESVDDTLGLFANARWYVHMTDDPYEALVTVGQRTVSGAALDLALLDVPMNTIDEQRWVRTLRERSATKNLRVALMLHDDKRSSAMEEAGIVGVVPRSKLDSLRQLLEDQSAQIMASLQERGALTAAVAHAEKPAAQAGTRKRRTPIAPREPIFVASQVAKIWDVDLKTVHNWVERGDIEAFRTPGRHLRFRRRSLLHFLRRYNMAIPEELVPARPRVMVVEADGRQAKKISATLSDLFDVVVQSDPVAALVELGGECSGANLIDALVVSLPSEGVDDKYWLEALSRHPDTRYTRIVVVTPEDGQRKSRQDLGVIATVRRNAIEQIAPVLEKALGLNQ